MINVFSFLIVRNNNAYYPFEGHQGSISIGLTFRAGAKKISSSLLINEELIKAGFILYCFVQTI
jgi:hypothetical protein